LPSDGLHRHLRRRRDRAHGILRRAARGGDFSDGAFRVVSSPWAGKPSARCGLREGLGTARCRRGDGTTGHPIAAHDLPRLDISATCRADQNKATIDNCMADENRARERLEKEWGQFRPADRTQCTQISSMKGFQSYVELITCLEMARDARSLPKDITQQ
jgi:hypothetical protein